MSGASKASSEGASTRAVLSGDQEGFPRQSGCLQGRYRGPYERSRLRDRMVPVVDDDILDPAGRRPPSGSRPPVQGNGRLLGLAPQLLADE